MEGGSLFARLNARSKTGARVFGWHTRCGFLRHAAAVLVSCIARIIWALFRGLIAGCRGPSACCAESKVVRWLRRAWARGACAVLPQLERPHVTWAGCRGRQVALDIIQALHYLHR